MIQGDWIAMTNDTNISLTITRRRTTFRYGTKSTSVTPYRIHPLQNPKGLDVLIGDGAVRCIYQIEKDRLKIGIPPALPVPSLNRKRPKWDDSGLEILQFQRN